MLCACKHFIPFASLHVERSFQEEPEIAVVSFLPARPRFPDFSGRLVESHFAVVGYLMDLSGHVLGDSSVHDTPPLPLPPPPPPPPPAPPPSTAQFLDYVRRDTSQPSNVVIFVCECCEPLFFHRVNGQRATAKLLCYVKALFFVRFKTITSFVTVVINDAAHFPICF